MALFDLDINRYGVTRKSDQCQSSPCSLTRNITSHSMKNLIFYRDLSQTKLNDHMTNSHQLGYIIIFERLGECAL